MTAAGAGGAVVRGAAGDPPGASRGEREWALAGKTEGDPGRESPAGGHARTGGAAARGSLRLAQARGVLRIDDAPQALTACATVPTQAGMDPAWAVGRASRSTHAAVRAGAIARAGPGRDNR